MATCTVCALIYQNLRESGPRGQAFKSYDLMKTYGRQIPSLLLDSLMALTSAKVNHLSTPGPAAQLSLYEKRELEAEYATQLKFIQSLLDQRPISPHTNGDTSGIEEDEDSILVQYPPYLRRPPARQGPFLLQPAPHELDSDIDEPAASDLIYILTDSETGAEAVEIPIAPAIGFLLVSYEDGKVDICADVAKVEATWTKPDDESVSRCNASMGTLFDADELSFPEPPIFARLRKY